MTRRSNVFLLLFFLSGAAALIYQVAWTRQFTPIIGNTVFSISAILTVFMAGLALGSWIFGRLIDLRPIHLIKTYALLEGGIGLYNLLLPNFLRIADPLFGALYASSHDSFLLLSAGRVAVSVSLLIVPATLMGGTLPILIRYYTENIASIGLHAGRVYTVNTWGAAIGTAAAGFFLIPVLGVRAVVMFAAVLNLLIAGVAWLLARTSDAPSTSEQPESSVRLGPAIVLAAMLLSGFAALANEVAWTRVLGLVVGPTTYAFTLMLTAMIAGLGLGAWLGSKWAGGRRTTLGTLAWIEIGVGCSSLALIPLFGELPLWIGMLVRRYVESFGIIQGIEFLIFFSIMLVPTTLLGMTFPIASKLYARSESLLGSEVSAVYAFNTVGGILGSVTAGFFLVPRIGSQSTLIVAAILNVIVGLMLAFWRGPTSASLSAKVASGFAMLAMILAIMIVPRWDSEVMASGAYKYAPYYASQLDMTTVMKRGDLLYFQEGTTTTVSVKRDGNNTMLAVDGKIDATDSGDMLTQKMLGHLPLLLSDSAKKVVNIGLGSGVTASAVLRYPIEKLDIIEISPEVVEASRFFEHVNEKALEDPRVELIIGDGRNHLRYTPTKYDVSISEPSNPWMSGMALLFTREFFEAARNRLSDRGIHCQWLHSYNMSTDDMRTVIRSFRSAFPFAALWALNEKDFLLLGSPSPIEVREDVVRANFERVQSDLNKVHLQDLYSLLSLYLIADEDLDRFAGDALLNTDDLPVLEFRSPRFIYANTTDENLEAIQEVQRKVAMPSLIVEYTASPTAENHRNKADMLLFSESYESAAVEFQRALKLDFRDELAWNGLLQTARGRAEVPVTKFIEEMVELNPEPVVLLAAAEHYQLHAEYPRSRELLDRILETDSENVAALERLCDVLASEGSLELAAVIEQLLAIDGGNARALFHQATVLQYQNRFDEAIKVIGRSIETDPGNMRARNLLAILYSNTFQYERAEAEFLQALEADPSDSISYSNYGLFLLNRGKYGEAIVQYERAIDIDPENVQGFIGLGESMRQSGDPDGAEEWYRKALRLAPGHPIARMYVDDR